MLIRAALPRLEGQELREDRLPEFKERVLALYRAEGYEAAEVDIAAGPAKDTPPCRADDLHPGA